MLGLLSVAQVHYGLAVAREVWQGFPSWDAPETRVWQATAGFTPLYSDPTREASESRVAATRPVGHLPVAHELDPLQGITVSSRLTRSPPDGPSLRIVSS